MLFWLVGVGSIVRCLNEKHEDKEAGGRVAVVWLVAGRLI